MAGKGWGELQIRRVGGGDFADFPAPAAGATDNGKVWAWNHLTQAFEPRLFLLASAASAFGLTMLATADAAAGRTALGLGTAAVLNVGTSANNIVQLDGTAKLPAVDGSALTNLPGGAVAGSTTQVIFNDAGAYAGDAGLTYASATDRLTVVGGLIAPSVRPPSDSTSAVQVMNAAGTAVVRIDTTNKRMTVGNANAPAATLDVNGVPDNVVALRLVSQVNSDLMTLTKSANGNIATISLAGETSNGFMLTNTSSGTFQANSNNYGYSSILTHAVDNISVTAGNFSAIQTRTAKGNNTNLSIGLEAAASSAITTAGVFGFALRATATTKNITPVYAKTASSATDSDAAAFDVVNSGATRLFGITPTGRLMTNQATTNTNTPSGATAKSLAVYDIAGALLGYIPVYASAW